MKILWHYLHHLHISLDLSSVTNIPPVRENNRSIINMLYERGWRGHRLFCANRFRKFKRVHRLSCITAMDGST
jgi:hypothetical protein